jgi:hypothetical protein
MGRPEFTASGNGLSVGVTRLGRVEANWQGETNARSRLVEATEPPLPLTSQRLELIIACRNDCLWRDGGAVATHVPRRVLHLTPPADGHRIATPSRRSLITLLPNVRASGVALTLAALLVFGAILWFIVIGSALSRSVVPAPDKGAIEALRLIAPPPILTAPATLQATAGTRIPFPIALAGIDRTPNGSMIAINGLARGSVLSAGRSSGETGWNLKPDEIGNLHLKLPQAESGNAKLTIQLVSPGGHAITGTATTLKVTAPPVAEIPVRRVKTQLIQAPAWGETNQKPQARD